MLSRYIYIYISWRLPKLSIFNFGISCKCSDSAISPSSLNIFDPIYKKYYFHMCILLKFIVFNSGIYFKCLDKKVTPLSRITLYSILLSC